MPISKHRPLMHVIQGFYKDRGQVQQSNAVQKAIETGQNARAERLEARKTVLTGIMTSGGLCKSLGA